MTTTKTVQKTKLSMMTKVTYGFGASAYGVKNNGFDYFLLLFYSQVIGVDAWLVGVALSIALVFDAVSDPVVGYLSDNWHSRFGRRHPFMYFSAIPVAFSYFFLWNPPQWTDNELFVYITILSILIRTLITLYETPSAALAAELTEDYDERTTLLSYRYYFGWTIGNLMSVIMFGVLLVASAEYPDGRLNPAGYNTYGIIASLVMLIAILTSALGTHNQIPNLKAPPPKRKLTLVQVFKEIFSTLAEKSALSLIAAALFGAVATGVSAALAFIMLTYFWELTNEQLFLWTFLVFLSAIIGMFLAPIVSKRLGKKKGAIVLGVLAFSIAPFPVVARLLGYFPANGDPILFPLLIAINTIDIGLIIAMQILFASMIADLVEQAEVRTKKRSEGIFFAAITLSRKSVQGLGVLVAGLILTLTEFPEQALPGEVSEDAIFSLGFFYALSLYILWSCMIACIYFYQIDRDKHEENLATLQGGTPQEVKV